MWTHHFRLALRTLARDKSAAALGGLSLAVAIGACVLIALFVLDELSYDRTLPGADRISAIARESEFAGERDASLVTPYVLAQALVDEVPAIETAASTLPGFGSKVFDGSGAVRDVEFMYADSTFFDVVALPAVAGDPTAALDAPDGLVLTASAARRLLGGANVVGRDLTFLARGDTVTFTVRAVVADLPQRSSLAFEAVAPIASYLARNERSGTGWGSNMWRTVALRREGASSADLQRGLDTIGEEDRGGQVARYLDVPLLDLRLSEFSQADGFGGNATFVRLFAAVALLILALGAINYVNLATARGARRAKEIGVRKALGSGRSALIRQFLVESVLLSTLAALVGLVLAALALPFFSATFGVDLGLGDLSVGFLAGLGVAAVAVGVVAGLYPAVYLSGFEPLRVLRGAAAPARAAGEAFLARTWLRRGLVVFQFAAVVLLLVATGTVARQLEYARSKPLGVRPDGLVVVSLTDPALSNQSEVVKRAFLARPEVAAAAAATGVPPKAWFGMGMNPDPEQEDLSVMFTVIDGDADYAETVGLDLVAGRWMDGRPSDAGAVVINEVFVQTLGWTASEAVGRPLRTGGETPNEVIGVVRDFHFNSLREPIGEVAMGPARADGMSAGEGDAAYSEVVVRLAPGREAAGLAALRETWAGLSSDAPFEARFVADDFAELSAEEERLAKTFGLFALIAVLIAALGLVGLATYTAERRTKEVGIRKVLGASVGGLVGLLSREYLALVALAALLVAPVAVVLVRRWLEGFAYHAPFSPLVLVGAALLALVLALVSVGVQALRAATADPVRALRSE